MIPAQFEYAAPTTVEEALGLLAQHGDDAKVIAGGQSLLPVLRLRLNAPEFVIDLGRIEALRGIREDGDALVIGAMTTHSTVGADPLVAEHAALLTKAVAHLADSQVRHRGTFGGALAHADPAGDLGAPALALGAEFAIAGPNGTRTVSADEFFVDLFETAIQDGELLTAVRIPKHTGWGAHYEKFVRVAHQWPIVAVAATVKAEGGTISEARVGLTNMGSTPLRASAVEQALAGQPATDEAVRAAVQAVAEGTNPPSDLNGDADYRKHLATVLTRRAVLAAAGPERPVDLTHRFTVPASVEETWDAFNDIGSVAECFPGAQVTTVEGDTFQGTVKVKLGPIALVYNGTGTFVEKDEASRTMKIEAKGKDKRGNGTAGANVTATMTANGAQTDVEVVTDLNITGKPAQFGRGVMQDVSDKLLGQFVDCLQTKVGSGAGPAAAPAAATATVPEPGTSTSEPAATEGAAPAPAPTPAPAAPAAPTPAAPAARNDDALDLGATVLPVLAKAYWKQAVAALVVIVVVVVVLVAVL